MPDIDHLSAENIVNLKKLADYLDSLPEDYTHFNMNYFLNNKLTDRQEDNKYCLGSVTLQQIADMETQQMGYCGTVACALGHGPAAGIPFRAADFISYLDESFTPSWAKYEEHFVQKLNTRRYDSDDTFCRLSNWFFDGDWESLDNHHWGAAARIRYVLDGQAIPEGVICLSEMDTDEAKELVDLYAPYRRKA